jgi:hypothetical protein
MRTLFIKNIIFFNKKRRQRYGIYEINKQFIDKIFLDSSFFIKYKDDDLIDEDVEMKVDKIKYIVNKNENIPILYLEYRPFNGIDKKKIKDFYVIWPNDIHAQYDSVSINC